MPLQVGQYPKEAFLFIFLQTRATWKERGKKKVNIVKLFIYSFFENITFWNLSFSSLRFFPKWGRVQTAQSALQSLERLTAIGYSEPCGLDVSSFLWQRVSFVSFSEYVLLN